jgi:type II secretory pathway pseudopilin PulG
MKLFSPDMPRSAPTLRRGASLIEVLVVIVVFLVGILAVVQIFPPGLAILRQNQMRSVAQGLADAEESRLNAPGRRIPEMIVPVTMVNGAVTALDPQQAWADLTPSGGGSFEISQAGQVSIAGSPVGPWSSVSGANHFVRVIGEGGPLPAATLTAPFSGLVGSVVPLTYGPMRYTRDGGTGLGSPGDLAVTTGDLELVSGAPQADEPALPWRVFVDTQATVDSFLGQTRVSDFAYVAFPSEPLAQAAPIRLRYTVRHVLGAESARVDVSAVASPAGSLALGALGYMDVSADGRYWVIDLKALAADANSTLFNDAPIDSTSYIQADPSSVRARTSFREVPVDAAFVSSDPLTFKVSPDEIGVLVFNPAASQLLVQSPEGELSPMEARVDYTVLDWRIVRDDIQLPAELTGVNGRTKVRLSVTSVKSRGTTDTDGSSYAGIPVRSFRGGENPTEAPVNDVIVFEPTTGGILVGGGGAGTANSFEVDYRSGAMTVGRSVANSTNVIGRFAYPDLNGTYGVNYIDKPLNGLRLRVLYRPSQEMSVQFLPAPSEYRLTSTVLPTGLRPGQMAAGGRPNPVTAVIFGTPNRIYFPLSDLGLQVSIDELVTPVDVRRGITARIGGTEVVNGVSYAFADLSQLGPGVTLSTTDAWPIRGARGVTGRVRTLWNHRQFALGNDGVANANAFEDWMRTWRRHQKTVSLGGNR